MNDNAKNDSCTNAALVGFFLILAGVIFQVVIHKLYGNGYGLPKPTYNKVFCGFIFSYAMVVVGFILVLAGLFSTNSKK